MTLSDPVANMLTVIRNAVMRNYKTAQFPYSKFKLNICNKLVEHKYLENCEVKTVSENKFDIAVRIAYKGKQCQINSIKKISKPSQHIHLKSTEVRSHCRVRGLYLLSTSQGLMSHRDSLRKNQGGKVILFIN